MSHSPLSNRDNFPPEFALQKRSIKNLFNCDGFKILICECQPSPEITSKNNFMEIYAS
jgi:hypothetical protein